MTPAEWERVKSCFFAAVALEAPEQATYLAGIEARDPSLAATLRELLAETSSADLDLRNPCWAVDSSSSSPASSGRALREGEVLLDRFEVQELLGAGGLGEVYRAWDRMQEIAVALKTPLASLTSDPDAIAVLRNELKTARAVTHPNICRLYDIHIGPGAAGLPFFTMELLEGVTLRKYVAVNGPPDAQTAFRFAEQLAHALDAAHARGIIHRDLKPTNIMITEGGSRLVVTDFGLAREVDASGDLQATLTGLAGTPLYMAPEQLHGARASLASDIYAFGVVLFEMVTGQPPFVGAGALDVALSKLREPAPSPRKFSPTVSADWETAILACLEQEPAKRPRSGAEVLAMIRRPSSGRIARRWWVAGAAGVCVAAAVGAAGALASRSRQLRVEVFDFDVAGESASDTRYLCAGLAREIVRRLCLVHGVVAVPTYRTRAEAGERSNADYMFTGTLQEHQGHYRLNVELISSREGQVLWSGNFDRRRGDNRLDVEVEVARSAVLEFRNALLREPGFLGGTFPVPGFAISVDRAAASPTTSGVAFEHYLKGTEELRRGTPPSLAAAVDYLERAVAEDPRFGLAYAALAEADLARLSFGDTPEQQYMHAAEIHARAAVQCGPLLPEAHLIDAAMRQSQWDWEGAGRSYSRALELQPNFARALRWRAGLHLQFARFTEAIEGVERAYVIDPFNAKAIAGHGLVLLFAGRLKDAVAFMEQNIGNRALPIARYNLVQAYLRWAKQSSASEAKARFARALEEAQKIHEAAAEGSALPNHVFALCHASSGDTAAAEPYLQRLLHSVQAGRTSPIPAAMVLAVEGRTDEALDHVERAIAIRSRNVIYLRVNVFLENLWKHDRFQAALRQLRLTA